MDTQGAVLVGDQRPAYWTAPPRHRDKQDGCRVCRDDYYRGGCGNHVAEEVLEWASGYWTLDDWQQWYLTEGLGVKPTRRWAATTTCIIVPRQNGKGTILEVRELAGIFLLGEAEVTHTAHLFPTARKHFLRCLHIIDSNSDLSKWTKKPNMTHGQEAIVVQRPKAPTTIFGPNGTMVQESREKLLQFISRNGKQGRGFTSNCLVYDESMFLRSEDIGATRPSLRAVANHQIWIAGSAGTKDSMEEAKFFNRIVDDERTLAGAYWGGVVLHNAKCPRDRSRGRPTNDFVVDCTDHDDRDDPEVWARSNPGMGIRVEKESFDSEILDLEFTEFNREILNVGEWPLKDDPWKIVDRELWDSLVTQNAGTVAPVALGVEVDEDGKAAAIGAAWYSGEGKNKKLVVSNPKDCVLNGTEGLVPQLAKIYNFIRKNFGPVIAIAVPKDGPAAGIGDELEKTYRDKIVRATSQDQATAFAFFTQQITEKHINHRSEADAPDLYKALGSAETRTVGDAGKTFQRRDAMKPVSPVSSVSLAAWILNKKRSNYDPLKSIG